jgi:hypothetical protein
MLLVRARLAALALSIVLMASRAAADPRMLAVPETAGWQHALTGVILMPNVAGFTRESIGDFGEDEYDIVAQYKGEGVSDGTVYLFHPGLDSVPVWFDRARRAIELRDIYAIPAGTEPRIAAFTPPGSNVASGLRATYALGGKSKFASTAVAVMPVGDWLLVVRVSSAMLNADALDARVAALAGGIRLPAGLASGTAAAPVSNCDPLKGSTKARQMAPDMTQALLASAGVAAGRKKHEALPSYCRASESGSAWGQYRVVGGGDGYVLAIGDAGRAVGVYPALTLSGPQTYTVSFMGLARTDFLPSFDRLPTPELALAAAAQGKPYASVSTIGDGSNITLDSGLAAKPK